MTLKAFFRRPERPGIVNVFRQSKRYKYEPLRGTSLIRIVEILPGQFQDPIQCRLVQADLSDPTLDYEALSYTWGDPTVRNDIKCNGLCLSVTVNLEAALRRLRLPTSPRRFWIDGVSVDQGNLAERSSQVQLMARVYGTAKRVVVWLGETADGSDAIMDFISLIQVDEDLVDNGLAADDSLPKGLPAGLWSMLQLQRLDHAFKTFLERPWFPRVWVKQEIAFAKTVSVLCGSKAVQWSQLYALCANMQNDPMEDVDITHGTPAMVGAITSVVGLRELRVKLRQDSHDESDAITTLIEGVERLSTDPRDKVYGFLSLIEPDDPVAPVGADYTISAADLYNLIAQRSLQGFDVRIVRLAGRQCQLSNTGDLRSWTPDWSNNVLKYSIIRGVYEAYGHTRLECRVHAGNVLAISGFSIDTVEAGGRAQIGYPSLPESESDITTVQELLEEAHEVLRSSTNIPPNCSWEEAFVATLTAHEEPPGRSEIQKLTQSFHAWREWIREGADKNTPSTEHTAFIRARSRASSFVDRIVGSTSQRRMCLLPRISLPGDIICILHGCSAPCILRKRGGFFELIGQCYVLGMMHGEAFPTKAGNKQVAQNHAEEGDSVEDARPSSRHIRESTEQVLDGKAPSPDDGNPELAEPLLSSEEQHSRDLIETQPSEPLLSSEKQHSRDPIETQPSKPLPRGWDYAVANRKKNEGSEEEILAMINEEMQAWSVDDPRDQTFRAGPVPAGWAVVRASRMDQGIKDWRPLFINMETGETTWEDPAFPESGDFPDIPGFRLI